MSLFKAREWWSTVCGAGEEFDGNCLCVANVDNDPEERSERGAWTAAVWAAPGEPQSGTHARCSGAAKVQLTRCWWCCCLAAVKIVTGSLQGVLRIYMPRQREYRPEDLLYEQELEQAILQLEVGRFST